MLVIEEARALWAVYRLLHQGRQLAGAGAASQTLFAYFDELDGLMGYIVSWPGQDKTAQFERELARVCTEYRAAPIIEEYKRT